MKNPPRRTEMTGRVSRMPEANAARSKLWLVRSELALGLTDRALRTCKDIIKADGNAVDAYVLRALALMYSTDLDQARKHLREALRLDPDHPEGARALKRVKRLEQHMSTAKGAFNARDFEGAKAAFTAALEEADAPQHAPLSASLHAERAAAQLRLKDFDAALKDACVAESGRSPVHSRMRPSKANGSLTLLRARVCGRGRSHRALAGRWPSTHRTTASPRG